MSDSVTQNAGSDVHTLTLTDKELVRFDYYLTIAQNLVSKQVRAIGVLTENGYENPTAVISDVRSWLLEAREATTPSTRTAGEDERE